MESILKDKLSNAAADAKISALDLLPELEITPGSIGLTEDCAVNSINIETEVPGKVIIELTNEFLENVIITDSKGTVYDTSGEYELKSNSNHLILYLMAKRESRHVNKITSFYVRHADDPSLRKEVLVYVSIRG